MKSENNIPKFDLAEQILSGQRRFNAAKRIAPKSRVQRQKSSDTKQYITSFQSQSLDHKIPESPTPDVLSLIHDNSTHQIISEIVARDIQNLRKR